MKKIKAGDRVGCGLDGGDGFSAKIRPANDYDNGVAYGKVTDVFPDGMAAVLWDDQYLNQRVYNQSANTTVYEPSMVELKFLRTESEAKAKHSDLEKAYNALAKQVKVKLKGAAKLIKEANKLAKKSGMSSLYEMYDTTAVLESAMDHSGWNTSSWGC